MTHQNDTGEKPQEGDEVAKSTRAITRFCADLKSGKASMMYETRENVEIYLLKGDDLDLLHDHIRTLIRAAEENAGLRARVALYQCGQRDTVGIITDLKKKLAAYQKAFNKVDDRMEYTGLTKEAFKTIAEELTGDLLEGEGE